MSSNLVYLVSCRPELLKSVTTSWRVPGGQTTTVWLVELERKRGKIFLAAILISSKLTRPRALTKFLAEK